GQQVPPYVVTSAERRSLFPLEAPVFQFRQLPGAKHKDIADVILDLATAVAIIFPGMSTARSKPTCARFQA
ncbi:MAG: hypothetical protein WBG50_16180, partial [Desulfomonilaceae bacterium]